MVRYKKNDGIPAGIADFSGKILETPIYIIFLLCLFSCIMITMEKVQTAKERKKAKHKLKKQKAREQKIKTLCKLKNQENFLYKYTKKMSMSADAAIKELKQYGVEVSLKQKQFEKMKKKEIKIQRKRHREKRRAQKEKETYDFDEYLNEYWCFDYENIVDYEIGRLMREDTIEDDEFVGNADDLPF